LAIKSEQRRSLEPKITYKWIGGKRPTFPRKLPIYIREEKVLSLKEVVQIAEKFGLKGPPRQPAPHSFEFGLPHDDFGPDRLKGRTPGEGYTLLISARGRQFDYHMIGWPEWSAQHPDLPSKEKAEKIATAFLRKRGLLPPELGKIEVFVDRAEFGRPTGELITAPAVWVCYQRKIDGYPTVELQGEPDTTSWVRVGIGSGGTVLTAWGLLPTKMTQIERELISIDEAIERLKLGFFSNVDSPISKSYSSERTQQGSAPRERKIIGIKLAYQLRYARDGRAYLGPVYIFSFQPENPPEGPEQVTIPAAKP
jgi:hypothetical protein